jgi:hypothetical protein
VQVQAGSLSFAPSETEQEAAMLADAISSHAVSPVPVAAQFLKFDAADIQIQAHMVDAALTIDIMKSGMRVHRVTLSDAASRLEHTWLAELFAREHKVDLAAIAGEMHDYVENLDINQG